MSDDNEELHVFVREYVDYLQSSFNELWGKVPIEPDKLEAYSAIGGLLARQVTLSVQMAESPGTWNGHSAPLFLRAMTDLQITLSWILLDIEERAKKYIFHGLGDAKLLMGQYRAEIERLGGTEESESAEIIADQIEQWINSQRRDFFVEVNLGHWAQLDYRTMAKESGCESLYNFAYRPFSQVAHSMWPHVSVYNCKRCENPLHRHHLIPELGEAQLDVDFMYRSCKYVHKTFELFVDKFSIELESPLPLNWWEAFFSKDRRPG